MREEWRNIANVLFSDYQISNQKRVRQKPSYEVVTPEKDGTVRLSIFNLEKKSLYIDPGILYVLAFTNW